MSELLLNVKNLSVDVEEKSILHGINLTINKGETHVLMGPNGAGKSTLGCTLMGNPNYHVTDGEIFFGGENITKEAADKRAKLGMFLSFQNPLEVPGISLSNFIRSALSARTGKNIRIWDLRRWRVLHTLMNNFSHDILVPMLDLRDTNPSLIFVRKTTMGASLNGPNSYSISEYYEDVPRNAINQMIQNP